MSAPFGGSPSVRCLVTGATGHIGAHLTRYLRANGHEVWAMVRPSNHIERLDDVLRQRGEREWGVQVVVGDLSDEASIAHAVQEARPEVVFHLAWGGITAGEREDVSHLTRNIMGTLRLLQSAGEVGCRAFVGLGSQAEYGPSGNHDILDTLAPLMRHGAAPGLEAYGLSKLCTGLLCHKMCELQGMNCVWLRLFATYGPNDDARHFIPTVIRHLLRGEKPALTAGEQAWDYLYVEDAAEAMGLAGLKAVGALPELRSVPRLRDANGSEANGDADAMRETPPQRSGTFELGSGVARPVRGIAERIRDLIAPTLPLGLGEVPYREGQLMHLQANIAPLQAFVPWKPCTPLNEGLRRTIVWQQRRQRLSTGRRTA